MIPVVKIILLAYTYEKYKINRINYKLKWYSSIDNVHKSVTIITDLTKD